MKYSFKHTHNTIPEHTHKWRKPKNIHSGFIILIDKKPTISINTYKADAKLLTIAEINLNGKTSYGTASEYSRLDSIKNAIKNAGATLNKNHLKNFKDIINEIDNLAKLITNKKKSTIAIFEA